MVSFRAWKAITMARLLELKKQYRGNDRAEQVIDSVIVKLKNLKARDLISLLDQLHTGSSYVPELLDIVPSPEQVERWVGGD